MSQLQNIQHDPTEIEKCVKDPVYFYNMYVRKEGEKVLTKEEYKELCKKWEQKRTRPKTLTTKDEYPLTPDECYLDLEIMRDKIEDVIEKQKDAPTNE